MKISEISIDDRVTGNARYPCEGFPIFIIKANAKIKLKQNFSTMKLLTFQAG